MSPEAEKLMDEFRAASEEMGYEAVEGWSETIRVATRRYEQAKSALVDFINKLEQRGP